MNSHWLLALIVTCGFIYFTEGKSCPEKTRPHKSRCDAYFKCIVLPSKAHVWVPEKCEEGLIYEKGLQMCVLPGDDWECDLGDPSKASDSDDNNVVYGVGVDGLSGVPDEGYLNRTSESEENGNDEIMGPDYIAVESGSDINREQDFEGSGDGLGVDYILLETTSPESKTSDDDHELHQPPLPTKVDPNLTGHLQRLSQLIDGLKQTYQNKDSAMSDLRPDQLNAFLAHYNIKSQLDSLNPAEVKTTPKTKTNQTLELIPTTPATSHLDPETKVVLTNHLPNNFYSPRPTDGYSNSQIVVNKPEGSVLFTLANQPQDTIVDHRYDPKISEDTLKTVLELSKQMIENQNVRRVLPNSAYYPQVVQPIYLPAPIPQYSNSPYNQHDGYEDKKYDKVSSTYYVPQEKPDKTATTIIHNNVIPVHVSSTSEEKNEHEQFDSYGQKVNKYPPLSDYHYSSGQYSDAQDHKLTNRYENNQLVTIRPNQYQHQNYQSYGPSTTSRPYISDSGSTLTDYYTPSPHLDETNVNNVFQVERYPTLGYDNTHAPHTEYQQSNYNPNRPDPSAYTQQKLQNTYFPVNSNPYQSYYYPNQQQSFHQLFPNQIDPSKVKIRPNSQKLESMEQETAEENDDDNDDEGDQGATGSASLGSHAETYNQYHTNKQIVASQLAQYMEQLNAKKPQKYNKPHRNRLPSLTSQTYQQNEDESQLGGLSGSEFPYDLFKTKLLTSPVSLYDSKPDLNNCPVGVRQPNGTDCTKYYVCSREDGRVMQYSCPPYTAFNPQTRICDARYYSLCHPTAVISQFTVSENRRIQLEAIKALQDAKRIRDQALQAQNIALRLRLGEESNGNKDYSQSTPQPTPQYSSEMLSSFLQNAIDSNSMLSTGSAGSSNNNNNMPLQQTTSVTLRPHTYGTGMVTKKRKYYCKEGDKVADQTSIYNYFVCYKNGHGMMKGHKMTCSQGLLFCPMTRMCTLSRKCT